MPREEWVLPRTVVPRVYYSSTTEPVEEESTSGFMYDYAAAEARMQQMIYQSQMEQAQARVAEEYRRLADVATSRAAQEIADRVDDYVYQQYAGQRNPGLEANDSLRKENLRLSKEVRDLVKKLGEQKRILDKILMMDKDRSVLSVQQMIERLNT